MDDIIYRNHPPREKRTVDQNIRSIIFIIIVERYKRNKI